MEGLCLEYGDSDDEDEVEMTEPEGKKAVQGLPGLGYAGSEELEKQLQPQSIDLGPLGGRVGGGASADPLSAIADDSSPQESESTAGQAMDLLEEDDPSWGLPAEIREPPPGEPDPKVVAKVKQFLEIQRKGKLLTESLRQSRDYRNPDFLRQAVEYNGIDEFGTCFPPDRFDPTSVPPEDFAASLAKEFIKYDEERKKKPAQSQPVDLTKAVHDKVAALAASGASQVKKSSSSHLLPPAQISKRQKWDSLPKAKD